MQWTPYCNVKSWFLILLDHSLSTNSLLQFDLQSLRKTDRQINVSFIYESELLEIAYFNGINLLKIIKRNSDAFFGVGVFLWVEGYFLWVDWVTANT